MEHLPIHLAYEAKVGGPVQYRWMYPFERKFYEEKRQQFPRITDMELDIIRDRDFPQWLLAHIRETQTQVDDVIKKLANGPSRRVSCYKGYFVNGFKFHTMRYRWDDLTDMQMKKVWNENASSRFREMIYRAKRNALENASEELGREPHALDMIGRGSDWMHTHIWDELVEKHWSGENYKGKCKIAQKNRMTEKEGCITKHTGGSISQGAHRMRMEKELGREVSELELFHRTHRRNHRIGDFVDNKSKKVNEDYMAKIGGSNKSIESPFDMQSWCEVTGGPSNGRIYGFGRSQSSDRFSKISVTSTLRESKERYNELTKVMDEKYNELTKKMEEELLRREAKSKKMLEQALEESRKREEDARRREEDAQRRAVELEEMVRKLIQEVGYTNRRFAGGSGPNEQQDFGANR
ncbi:UNVERIFIED_CONTAM: hypothetical protein Sradi_4021100 [Sesamum radiatum]|uniref:DUF4218 domain-containing protein n=1 Tax=Sesamum radiatum TaxID=300843 RepID=A0AAW2PHN6_SESRA